MLLVVCKCVGIVGFEDTKASNIETLEDMCQVGDISDHQDVTSSSMVQECKRKVATVIIQCKKTPLIDIVTNRVGFRLKFMCPL